MQRIDVGHDGDDRESFERSLKEWFSRQHTDPFYTASKMKESMVAFVCLPGRRREK